MFACTDYLQHVGAQFSSKRIMQNKRTTQQRQGGALSQNNPYLFVSIYNKTIIHTVLTLQHHAAKKNIVSNCLYHRKEDRYHKITHIYLFIFTTKQSYRTGHATIYNLSTFSSVDVCCACDS